MNESLVDFLNREAVDGTTLRHATRYYIAERYGDVPPAKMKKNIEDAGVSPDTIGDTQKQLEQDSMALENACLALLSAAWSSPEEQQRIRNAVAEARSKLPVIEIAIIATVAMYAMYLTVTGGKVKETVVRKPDGSYEKTVEYHKPTGPLGSLVSLITGPKGDPGE